jgi:hypothetical protein
MKTTLITILLAFVALAGKAQELKLSNLKPATKEDLKRIVWSNGATFNQKPDTVKVIAFCQDTIHSTNFTWRKMYALIGISHMAVNINGVMLYKEYLMPDKKTKPTFKVIYAIED